MDESAFARRLHPNDGPDSYQGGYFISLLFAERTHMPATPAGLHPLLQSGPGHGSTYQY